MFFLQDRDTKLWTLRGKVVAIRPSGKSYIVRTRTGNYLRGMRFIKADKTEGPEQVFKVVMSATSPGAGLVSCMKAARSSMKAVSSGTPRRRVTFDRTVEYVA